MYYKPWYSAHEYADIVEKYNIVCNVVQELADVVKQLEEKIVKIENNLNTTKTKRSGKCRFFNRGYCREAASCPYVHPEVICQEYLTRGICSDFRSCPYRHPQECRYWKETQCYRRDGCSYLHQKVDQKDKVTDEVEVNKKEPITIEVLGKKVTTSNIGELNDDVIKALTIDDLIKLYESEEDDIAKLIAEDTTIVVDEETNVEDILKFYENKSIEELCSEFKEFDVDTRDASNSDELVNSKENNLRRSTRKKSTTAKND